MFYCHIFMCGIFMHNINIYNLATKLVYVAKQNKLYGLFSNYKQKNNR